MLKWLEIPVRMIKFDKNSEKASREKYENSKESKQSERKNETMTIKLEPIEKVNFRIAKRRNIHTQ